MKKRFGCALLATLLCVSACGGQQTSHQAGTSQEETTKTEVEVSYLDALGEKDFGGKTFTFLGVHYAARRNFGDEEATGEVVNDALVERDRSIAERYNVQFEYVIKGGSGGTAEVAKTSILANEDDYNLIIDNIAMALHSLMVSNLLMDMNTLPTLDLSREWWSPGMVENAQLDGKMYITMGDISPQKYYAPYVMCYNRKLAEDYHLPDMFSLVLDGKWTLSKFGELTKDLTHDVDGNAVIDYDDFFGYIFCQTATTGLAHYVGAGGTLCSTADGETTVDLDTARSIDIIEAIQQVLDLTGIASYNSEVDKKAIKMFKEDRALFYGNSLSVAIAEFRDMESDFGIIPVPKYDEQQEDYYAYINTWCLGGSGVPKTVQETEMTGFIMEALCYSSYETVRPAVCEVLIKQKVSREDANMQVMDMIFDNTYCDLNAIFDFGGSASFLGNSIVNDTDFVSGYTAISNKIDSQIQTLMEELS